LLQAFSQVLQSVPNAILIIAGSAVFNRDGEYEELLRNTVGQLGLEQQVRFLGERDDVPDLMPSFDCLVVNSSIEPFGLVVVEGMAAQLPVIATRTGGIPEIIRHERNGFLFPVRDIEALAQTIVTTATDTELRNKVATEARHTVESQFSYVRFVKDIQEFYENQQGAVPAVQNVDAGELRKPRMLAEQE
jgi:glycosyltransferase involved in cell wall biosynthesis